MYHIIYLKIIVFLIITNITNINSEHDLFPLNLKTQNYTFTEGKKPNFYP
jgi:hypothetical protein